MSDTDNNSEQNATSAETPTTEPAAIEFAKKAIKMPILPATPTKAVDGRPVTQELIDGVLAYDASKRTAIVSLNNDSVHGKGNDPVLGKVDKVYQSEGLIYADVFPVKGMEEVLPQLASESYPDRSIEADFVSFEGAAPIPYLEAIKLCGSQRPALNLPPVSFSKSNQTVSYKFSLTGGTNTMPEEKQVTPQEEPKATPPAAEKEEPLMYGAAQPIAKVYAKDKADFAMREQEYRERIEKLEALNLDRELDHWSKSPKMLRKLPQFARANAINLLKAEYTGQSTVTFHFARGPETIERGDGWKALLESLPDTLISTGQVAAHIDNTEFDDIPVTSQEKQNMAFSKMRAYAKANNLDLNDPKVFEKVEREVKKENPELREGQ